MDSSSKTIEELRQDAGKIFSYGLQAVEPGAAVKKYCRLKGEQFSIGDRTYDLSCFENITVIGAGKATAPMARALEEILGDRITGGTINVKYGHVAGLNRIGLIEAGHPVPDENGVAGSEEILTLAKKSGPNDLVLCLMSGGGSALLPLPSQGLSLKDKQETSRVLLACGATIHEINTIRKHMSTIKGGQLTRAVYPATLAALILSDVVGDDLDVIASGPTVPDPSTFKKAMEIFEKYDILGKLPAAAVKHIEAGISGDLSETPKTGDPVFERVQNIIIGSNFEAVTAASHEAERLGYHTLVLSSMIEGETKEVALVHGAIAREVEKTGHPVAPPACILSGGETTVTITGNGLGGRCQEFALAAAFDISGHDRIVILCGGTDGNDGPTDAAGAVADGRTIRRAEALGLNAREFLSNNDAYHFFKSLDDLLMTGPTNTNVMDLRILLVT
jgi:glycerate 2-kinase